MGRTRETLIEKKPFHATNIARLVIQVCGCGPGKWPTTIPKLWRRPLTPVD